MNQKIYETQMYSVVHPAAFPTRFVFTEKWTMMKSESLFTGERHGLNLPRMRKSNFPPNIKTHVLGKRGGGDFITAEIGKV